MTPMTLDQAIEQFLPAGMKGMKLDHCLTLEIYDRDQCYLTPEGFPEGIVFGRDYGSVYIAFFDGSGVHSVEPEKKRYFINSSVALFLTFLEIFFVLGLKWTVEQEAENREYTVEKHLAEMAAAFSRLDPRAMVGETYWTAVIEVTADMCG